MKTILVTYRAESKEILEKFYGELVGNKIGEHSRADEGNIKYEYYFSADKDNELLLVEMWESEEFLAAHGKKEHMKKIKELREKYGIEGETVRL